MEKKFRFWKNHCCQHCCLGWETLDRTGPFFQKPLQWMTLNGITLCQIITYPINRMILISKWASTYVRYDRVIWDFLNLDNSDSINQLIPLSVIPLSSISNFCSKQSKEWIGGPQGFTIGTFYCFPSLPWPNLMCLRRPLSLFFHHLTLLRYPIFCCFFQNFEKWT